MLIAALPVPAPSSSQSTNTAATTLPWSFQPLRTIPIPPGRSRNPIDRFVEARREAKGLKPVKPASKPALLRRVTFDLLGLPPAPEEVDAFARDKSPAAFAKVVDRLLASPRYGERWGRHWLDVVRYADTAGDSSDYPVPQAYKYRNYVIDAFNADKPYDLFLKEQLAGDLMPAASEAERRERIIATGFIAIARRFGTGGEPHLTIEDTLDTLSKATMGFSLSCARCHDHKFDPVTMRDYYALYGFFSSTRYPHPGNEDRKQPQDFVALQPPEEVDAILRPYQTKLAGLERELAQLETERANLSQLENAPANGNAPAGAGHLRFNRNEDYEQAIALVKRARDDLRAHPPRLDLAYAVADGPPGNARLQERGDPASQREEIPRGFVAALGGQKLPGDATGSGRLQLAEWIASPTNPLTARVMVNRIWQHHFGRGIVATPDDFGQQGARPTHPELLDWLAGEFIRSGWSVKTMHRLILLSDTYQLSSADEARNAQLDPSNQWLWRFNRRRLDAESLRDAVLSVSGQLDLARGGEHPFPPSGRWNFTQHFAFSAVYESNLRSVYLMQQRLKRHPLLGQFDGADPNACTGLRQASITPLQALFGLNSEFMDRQADHFATRLDRECKSAHARIARAWRLACGRAPTWSETREGLNYIRRFAQRARRGGMDHDEIEWRAWESYCRAILNSNEFVFVD
jgi:hypothetical protein